MARLRSPRKSTRELYNAAYHRIRTLNSRRLVWEQDTYPTGFNCPSENECSRGWVACGCLEDAEKEHTANLQTVKEANRLLTVPIDGHSMLFASKSYADRLNFLDFSGRDYDFALNPELHKKLAAKRKIGLGYRFRTKISKAMEGK